MEQWVSQATTTSTLFRCFHLKWHFNPYLCLCNRCGIVQSGSAFISSKNSARTQWIHTVTGSLPIPGTQAVQFFWPGLCSSITHVSFCVSLIKKCPLLRADSLEPWRLSFNVRLTPLHLYYDTSTPIHLFQPQHNTFYQIRFSFRCNSFSCVHLTWHTWTDASVLLLEVSLQLFSVRTQQLSVQPFHSFW